MSVFVGILILALSLVVGKRNHHHHDNAERSIDDILNYIGYLEDEISAYDDYLDHYYNEEYDDMNLLQELLSKSHHQKTRRVPSKRTPRRKPNNNRLITDNHRGYNKDYDGFSSRFIETSMMMNGNGNPKLDKQRSMSFPPLPDEPFVHDIPEYIHENVKPQRSALAKAHKNPPPPPPKPSAAEAKVLYHATNKKAAEAICNSKKMILGKSGAFGAGIYFAATQDAARLKAMLSLGHLLPIGQTDLSVWPAVLGQGEYVIKASVAAKWLKFDDELDAKLTPIVPPISEYDDMDYGIDGPTGTFLTDDVRAKGKVTWKDKTYIYRSFPTILKAAKGSGIEVGVMSKKSYGIYHIQIEPWLNAKSISTDYVSNSDVEKYRSIQLHGAEYVVYKPDQVKILCAIPKKGSPPIKDCVCKKKVK